MASGPVTVKLAGMSVDEFISSLKVALIFRLISMPVASLTGMVEIMLGAVLSALPVTKHQAKSVVRGFFPRSLMPVMIVAVYLVLGIRLTVGLNTAILLVASKLTVPAMAVVPSVNLN